MKILNIVKFYLSEYCHATWLYFEAIICAVFLFFTLFSTNAALITAPDVYINIGIISIISSFFTAMRILDRETNPRIYVMLTKKISRREYLISKLTASSILSGIIILALFSLEFFLTSANKEYSILEGYFRFIPIFGVIIICSAVVTLFSRLVMKNPFSIGWAVIVMILSFAQPPGFLNYMLPPVQQLIKSSFKNPEQAFLFYLPLCLLYSSFIFLTASYFFKKRELNYEQN